MMAEAMDTGLNYVEGDESESNDDDESESNDDDENEHMVSLIYRKGVTQEPFEQWLYNRLPSAVEKEKGYDWIAVTNRLSPRLDIPDLDGLKDSWERFLASGGKVNYQIIKQLALNHNVRSGKWMLFASSGGKIDHLWTIMAKAVVGNQLPCEVAKVSAYDPNQGQHVVCVYNNDFSNFEQVMSAEQAIRNIGVKCKLLYKPDVYTYLGVYSKNEWNVRPNIFISMFDILKGTSVIDAVDGVTP